MKIAVCHPQLVSGGSEARVFWTIQALAAEHDVTLVTTGPVDLPAMQARYGTQIDPQHIGLRIRPLKLVPRTFVHGLRGALFVRFCRAIRDEFDLMISAYNPVDFGVPGIHFLADLSWDETMRRRLHPPPKGWRGAFHRLRWLRAPYRALLRLLAPPTGRSWFDGEDCIVANSKWVARQLRERHGFEAAVVYPAIPGTFPNVPLEKRDPCSFVCLGRIVAEKRVERVLRTMARVRELGHPVQLHIVGEVADDAYGKRVRALAVAAGDWVTLRGARWGAEKLEILGRCRYGIHGTEGEAFGIAVAEMVKAGCVPFVPAEGGAAEVVGLPELTFASEEEGARRIDALLRNPAREAEVRAHLGAHGELFSSPSYVAAVRRLVRAFAPASGARPEERSDR